MAVLTRPVSISAIRSALGAASNATLSQLCTHANVNKWSKYKPIKYAANGIMSQYDYINERWKDDATWWKGANNNCGFTPYTTTSWSNVVLNTTGGMNGWVYDGTPTGGTYPYRQADFIGYNPDAVPAAQNFLGTTRAKNLGQFSAQCDIAASGFDNISLEDFAATLYFGVAICNSNGVVYHGTNSNAWDASITFQLAGISQGSYTVVPFLCTQAITPQVGGFTQTYTFWTIPNVSPYTLQIVATTATITCTGSWLNAAKTRLSVTIENGDPTSYTGTVYVRYSNHDWTDNDTTTEPSSSFTISGNGTVTKTFNNLSSDHYYRAQVRLTNGDLFEVGIEEEFDPNV